MQEFSRVLLARASRCVFSDDLVYEIYRRQPPPDSTLEALIGAAFRLTSINLLFTSDVMADVGVLVAPDQRLGLTDFADALFQGGDASSASRTTPGTSSTPTIASARRTSASSSWSQQQQPARDRRLSAGRPSKIGLMHNADDILLSAERSRLPAGRVRRTGADLSEGRPFRQHGRTATTSPTCIDFFSDRGSSLSDRGAPRRPAACSLGSLLGGCAGTPPLPPEIAAQPELAEVAQRALGARRLRSARAASTGRSTTSMPGSTATSSCRSCAPTSS